MSNYFTLHPPLLETSGFLRFPRAWVGIETGAQLANFLAGPVLPPSSAWNWGAREREYEALIRSRAWKRSPPTPPRVDAYYLPWLDRSVRRERLPIIERAHYSRYRQDKRQQREKASLEWIYGREVTWGEDATVKECCKPLYEYVVQRANAVAMVSLLLTHRGVAVGGDCARMMRAWDDMAHGDDEDEDDGSEDDDEGNSGAANVKYEQPSDAEARDRRDRKYKSLDAPAPKKRRIV